MPDNTIERRFQFFRIHPSKARFTFGNRVSFSLPLDHPLSLWVENFTEQVRTGDMRAFAGLLAELTSAPPPEEVAALLRKILYQMRDPDLSTEDMRSFCALYAGLVELLPTDPWLYRLVDSELRHWTDESPDRMLQCFQVIYAAREKIRERDHGCYVLSWRGGFMESWFEEKHRVKDYSETKPLPAVLAKPKGKQRIGPALLGLPAKLAHTS